ncbi:unnamed protein product [Gordionus sp. m RMFG-2023]
MRYYKRYQESGILTSVGQNNKKRIFTEEEEGDITKYLIQSSQIFYGLSIKKIKILAYQMAVNMKKKFPKSWKDNSMAGHDWYLGFMSRNPTLSLRSPEATSMARATGFNEENVLYFFDLYKRILDEHKLECMAIYNMDETGLTTVQTPSKIIAQKGQKQVGSITSAERGTLITLALAVNAIGHTIPPMFLFPRKKYYDYFVRDGPSGSIGVSNGSG